ncbi:ROK family protein [Parablautia muri]|uniref:fructokinase n=1 Tax=Parablautia muri TaxID=2320879 RepID=A0A9X5BF13_9FIRM|nr:ROK family protein [Parablautia muri]NBJ92598.1 ROK family protein [Parablautia muri]
MRLGALEAGGTKMVCAVGDETGKIFEQICIPTRTPEETVPEMLAYFKKAEIEALGIGCFGPIDPDKSSATYGYITSTPKLAWRNYNIVGAFEEALGCPVGFDTDVNGSALGEVTFGQAKGKNSVIYITIGTGVGAGIFVEGNLVHGMLHPEAGHVLIQKREDDTYQGKCPYHKCCLEGLAAGPAIEERWGKKAIELKDREEVWDLESYYIAQALVGYILTVSPEMIILGGGVMHQEQLFPKIRSYVKELLNGYIRTEELEHIESYIVPASLQDNQGIMGCLELGRRALENQ